MKKSIWGSSICLALLFRSASLFADQPEHPQESEEPDVAASEELVVVTGTRTEKLITEAPVKVDVITSAELEKLTLGTLEQALEFMPGVYITRSQKEGFNVMLQGFSGDRVLVLVDGLKTTAPTGASTDFGQLSALNIERIELVRGASSALYGSEAFGGVINIITSKEIKNSFQARYELGEYTENLYDEQTKELNLSGALDLGTIGFKNWGVDGSYQDLFDPPFSRNENASEDVTADHDKEIVGGRILYRTEDAQAIYKFERFSEYKHRSEGRVANLPIENFYKSDVVRDTHVAIFKYMQFEIKGQHSEHDEESGNRGNLRDSDIQNTELDAQYAWQTGPIEWVTGTRLYDDDLYQSRQDSNTPEADAKRDGYELFAQADWQASDNLEVVGGGRYQDDDGFGSYDAYKVSSMYSVSPSEEQKFNWRASLGQAYRVPTLKQNYYIFDHSNLGYMVLGSETLVPEEGWALGTGFEWIDKNIGVGSLKTSIDFHYSETDNFITTELNPQLSSERNLAIYEYINIGETEISGFDVDLNLTRDNQRYRLSYNYLHAVDSTTNQRLTDRPYHQIKGNANYTIPSWNLNILAYFTYQRDEVAPFVPGADISVVSERLDSVVDDVFTFNLTFTHDITDEISWKLGAENLFNEIRNEDHDFLTEFDPRPETGRYIFISLNYQI